MNSPTRDQTADARLPRTPGSMRDGNPYQSPAEPLDAGRQIRHRPGQYADDRITILVFIILAVAFTGIAVPMWMDQDGWPFALASQIMACFLQMRAVRSSRRSHQRIASQVAWFTLAVVPVIGLAAAAVNVPRPTPHEESLRDMA